MDRQGARSKRKGSTSSTNPNRVEETADHGKQGEPGDQALCGTCNLEVADDHQALVCNLCDIWHHIACEKIPKDVYAFLTKNVEDSIHWYCRKCNAVTRKLVTHITKIQEKHNKLEEKFTNFEKVAKDKFEEMEVNTRDIHEQMSDNRCTTNAMEIRLGTVEAKLIEMGEKHAENFENRISKLERERD